MSWKDDIAAVKAQDPNTQPEPDWKADLASAKADGGDWKAGVAAVKSEPAESPQPDQTRVDELIKGLRGRVAPRQEDRVGGTAMFAGPAGMQRSDSNSIITEQTYDPEPSPNPNASIPPGAAARIHSTDALLEMGYDYDQLKDYTKAMRALEPSFLQEKGGQALGAAIGSVAIPAAVNLIPGMAALPEELATGPVGAKIGASIPAIFGAGTGGMVGKTTQQYLDPYQDVDIFDILLAGAEEAGMEAGTRGVLGGIKGAWHKAFGAKPIVEAQDAMRFFADEMGGILPPSQTNKSLLVKLSEGATRDTFGGKAVWEAFDEGNKELYEKLGQKISNEIIDSSLDIDPTVVGREFLDQISRKGIKVHGPSAVASKTAKGRMLQEIDETVSPLYKKFAEMTGDIEIPTKGIKEWANEVLKQHKRIEHLPNNVLDEINYIAKRMPDSLTVGEMRAKRSAVGALANELTAGNKAGQSDVAELFGKWSDQLFSAEDLKSLAPEHRQLLHNANKIYEQAMISMDSPEFKFAMAKKIADNPEAVRNLIIPKKAKAGTGALQRIQALKEGLVHHSGELAKKKAGLAKGAVPKSKQGQQAWDMIRKSWLAGEIENGSLEKSLKGLGKKAEAEMFDAGERRIIKNYVDVGKKIGAHKASGGGALAMRSAQIRAAQGIVGGGLLAYGNKNDSGVAMGAGGAVLVGPYVIARLMTSGKVGQGLVKQITKQNLKPVKSAGGPLLTRTVKFLLQQDSAEKKAIRKDYIRAERSKLKAKAIKMGARDE